MSSLYKKLHQIQCKINGLAKDKSTYNYKYVTGDKLLGFVKPLMNELGLLLKQEITSIENDRQDYSTKNGEKSEILSKVMQRFTWIDIETGEKDVNEFGANGQNDWEKGLGSALTYAERYFLLKYFHIPTDEDDIDNELRKKVDEENHQNTPIQENTYSPANDTDKLPWLNENDENWKKIDESIQKGEKIRLSSLQKRFKMSKATVDLLKTKFQIQ
ncbi:hypothetical protein CHRYSEOSP005_07150 [Chryseobacterium sp. Alg-005]|uniref:ERF family protein n=1 Tax=Chryseobacterium sp. Alg-005 TaxID=3159516 RepID=UPI003555ADE3